MDVPEHRYARSGDLNIAFQVVGEGPLDVAIVPALGRAQRLARADKICRAVKKPKRRTACLALAQRHYCVKRTPKRAGTR